MLEIPDLSVKEIAYFLTSNVDLCFEKLHGSRLYDIEYSGE